MEIERKYLIDATKLPFSPEDYPVHHIEQGYLCTEPVVRIRKDNEDYFLTYKSKGLMIREEYNLPLTKEAYDHLKSKVDGRIISKKRYVIPLTHFIMQSTYSDLKIELDIFSEDLQGACSCRSRILRRRKCTFFCTSCMVRRRCNIFF